MTVIGKFVFLALFSYFAVEVVMSFMKLWDQKIGTAVHGKRYLEHSIMTR